MRLFAATYLVPISVWDRGTSLEVVMHPACASLITRCVLSRTPVPVSSSPSKRNEAPISTSTLTLPPFHALTRTDQNLVQYLVNSVSQSLSRSCRAVPVSCRDLDLDLGTSWTSSPPSHLPLFSSTTLPSTWSSTPLPFTTQPASQIYFLSPGTFPSHALPDPARPWNLGTRAPEPPSPALDWT